MITPTQIMMRFMLDSFEEQIEEDEELQIDEIFTNCLAIERNKIKLFFIEGILLAREKDKDKPIFCIDTEFEKVYYRIFPSE